MDLFPKHEDLGLLVRINGAINGHCQVVLRIKYFLLLLHELLLEAFDLSGHDVIYSLLFGIEGAFRLHAFLLDPCLRLACEALQDESQQVLVQDGSLELEEFLSVGQINLSQCLDIYRRRRQHLFRRSARACSPLACSAAHLTTSGPSRRLSFLELANELEV